MNLTGKQLVERGIITKVDNPECIQQVGVDLELIEVRRIVGKGFIPKEGKTKLAERQFINPIEVRGLTSGDSKHFCWDLPAGTYDIVVKQGCKIPSTQRLRIVHRSSAFRNGTELNSSMFDPGFETENIGTIIHVDEPILIEVGARIGQAYVTEVNPVENLYNGQWQGDKQRKDS